MTAATFRDAVDFFRTQYPNIDPTHWTKLAEAEQWANGQGHTFQWRDDWEIPSHVDEFDCYDEEPSTCEWVEIVDAEGDPIGPSLGCVDDATDDYRRVIEAELAWEAMPAFAQLALPLAFASVPVRHVVVA